MVLPSNKEEESKTNLRYNILHKDSHIIDLFELRFALNSQGIASLID